MEAIGSGLPIILTFLAAPDLVTEGKNGYLIPPSADQVVTLRLLCFCGKNDSAAYKKMI